VRIHGELFVAKSAIPPAGRFSLEATLAADGSMRLLVNGRESASAKAPGPIPTQPIDDLSLRQDTQTAVGDYSPPNPFSGKVENVRIVTR
jgi:hypothetical protein